MGMDAAMCATTGVMVAAYRTLLIKLPKVKDTLRINIVAVQASPWVRWLARSANCLTTPVRTRAPTMMTVTA